MIPPRALCGSNASDDRPDRAQQDDAVEDDALVLDVGQVVIEVLVNGHRTCRADLPKASDARSDAESLHFERSIRFHDEGHFWAWTHQTHLSFQDIQ